MTGTYVYHKLTFLFLITYGGASTRAMKTNAKYTVTPAPLPPNTQAHTQESAHTHTRTQWHMHTIAHVHT